MLVLISLTEAGAQVKDYLMVYRPGKSKRYYYFVGDFISVKPVRDFPVKKGNVYALSDSCLYFSATDSILFSEISAIVIREDKRLLPKNLWLYNLASTGGAMLIWEAMYAINQGKLSPQSQNYPYILGIVTLAPVLINKTAQVFRKDRLQVEDGQWKLGAVILPRPPVISP